MIYYIKIFNTNNLKSYKKILKKHKELKDIILNNTIFLLFTFF